MRLIDYSISVLVLTACLKDEENYSYLLIWNVGIKSGKVMIFGCGMLKWVLGCYVLVGNGKLGT